MGIEQYPNDDEYIAKMSYVEAARIGRENFQNKSLPLIGATITCLFRQFLDLFPLEHRKTLLEEMLKAVLEPEEIEKSEPIPGFNTI